ncbi:MAG TPA: serine hydrolase domain-containing protein [Methylomirabilota bacterium]|nr:serine hydrolase domain-containing protein [Methylomirabilota bacterium]
MFQRAREVIHSGLREHLHLGAELFVSRDGNLLIDEPFGEAREGVVMQRDSIMLWFSAGKPLTAVAVGQLVERGLLTWHTPVAEIIPEFAQNGKERVTVWHLLTHTAGMRNADAGSASTADEKLAWIYAQPLESNWVPGERAGYHVKASWQVLGEIVRRLDGKPVEEFLRSELFLPLGMRDSSLALSEALVTELGPRLAFVYETGHATPKPKEGWNSLEGFSRPRPGGSARGPVRELGRFYEALLNGGENVLRPETVELMTSRQRVGMFDETFQFKMDWGPGFIINSNRDGFQMPYGYGRYASPETFGHSGNQASCAFADPKHRLVVAWACNGMPGERKHQQRQRAINNSIYEDLGLTNG